MSIETAKKHLLSTITTIYRIPARYGSDTSNRCEIYVAKDKIRHYTKDSCAIIAWVITGSLAIKTTPPCNKELGFFSSKQFSLDNKDTGRFEISSEESLNNDFISIDFEFFSIDFDNVQGDAITDINENEFNVEGVNNFG